MGVPVVGCFCPVCTSSDQRNYRTRTSALLRVAGLTLLIDAGPDFRAQALAQRLTSIDAILLTHAHYDHVAGIDDLRPLTEHGQSMPMYGQPETIEDVRQRFSYAFTGASDGSTRPALSLHTVQHNEPFTVTGAAGSVDILPFAVQHGTWTITGYRIHRLGYVTDASALNAVTRSYLTGLDVLVLNALRFTPHPTHFHLQSALEVIRELRPQRAFLVHLSHAFDHESVNASLPKGVMLAYDGLQVQLEEE